ncbi:unnamed protein product [Prunus armeniaca]
MQLLAVEPCADKTAWKLRRHGQLTFLEAWATHQINSMEAQKAWAADIPRGMGYTSNQQHGNLMGSSDKWEQLGMGVLHQPKGEHEFALYK